MKKYFIPLFLLLSFAIFAENKVSITTSSNKVTATVALNESEYLTLDERFLYLNIDSEHYNFVFSGYPEGVVQDSGAIYYDTELTLEGTLTLKDGVEPGDYNIQVHFGFQTCDKAGICNIPVEVTEDILVKEASKSNVPYISALIGFVLAFILILFRKKRAS